MCNGGEVSARTMRFFKVSPFKVELRRSIKQYILYVSLLILAVILSTDLKLVDFPIWHQIIRIAIIVIPFCIGIIGLTIGFRIKKIVINKEVAIIEIIPGITGKKRDFKFDQIKSLQLLHHRTGEDNDDCYEINLVFFEPENSRFNLANGK